MGKIMGKSAIKSISMAIFNGFFIPRGSYELISPFRIFRRCGRCGAGILGDVLGRGGKVGGRITPLSKHNEQ